jgi:hypothetical protein
MPKVPRGLTQEQAIRAFVNAGGVEVPSRGKGSHRSVMMPNGFPVVLPHGIIKPGLLADQIKGSDLSLEEFIRFRRKK